jgi:serine/threonine protein kinase
MAGIVCEKCSKELRPEKRGSLTQWIFDDTSCSCQKSVIKESTADHTSTICPQCFNFRPSRRSGSMTQWIFQRNQCKCGSETVRSAETSLKEDSSEVPSNTLTPEPEPEEDFSGLEMPFSVARYKPLRFIARSANSVVYKCFDRQLGRLVAIKTLLFKKSTALIQFQQEARATGLLKHSNIVEVLDFGVVAGGDSAYMVLEYVEATNLEDWLQTRGPFSEAEAIALITGVCSALNFAHSKGIYHRDLKPQNILINSNREPKLIDFGLALMLSLEQNNCKTQGLSLVGTPSYMCPDQFLGLKYDARSEIYSLGCVLFACLTGVPPFLGDSPLELARQHAECPVPTLQEVNPDRQFSEKLEQVTRRCLEKSPERRYSSIGELANELQIEITGANQLSSLFEHKSIADDTTEDTTRVNFPWLITCMTVAIVFMTGIAIYSFLLLPSQPDKAPVNETKKPVRASFSEMPFNHTRATKQHVLQKTRSQLDQVRIEYSNNILLIPEALKMLASQAKNCRQLGFRDCNGLTAKNLQILSPMNITHINVESSDLTNDGLEVLSTFKNLLSIQLTSLSEIDNTGLATLKRCPHLTDLILEDMEFNAETLRIFSDMNLRLLHLSTSENFDEAGLASLRKSPISELRLNDLNITDQGLTLISTMPKLALLQASRLMITDRGVASLTNLPQLHSITLSHNKGITDGAVKTLEVLYARSKNNPSALEFTIDHTSITSASVPQLKRMKGIKRLDVSGLEGFNARILRDLKEALPNTEIVHIEEDNRPQAERWEL